MLGFVAHTGRLVRGNDGVAGEARGEEDGREEKEWFGFHKEFPLANIYVNFTNLLIPK
jgi:hypothetical protein